MQKIVTTRQMKNIEDAADKAGISYETMMENAGKAVAEEIIKRYGKVQNKKVLILVGPGNNGGDGLVAGFYLSQKGAAVELYLSKKRASEDKNFDRVVRHNLPVYYRASDNKLTILENKLNQVDIIIDALLGTGIKFPLKGNIKVILEHSEKILQKRVKRPLIIAVDCPSGLNCDTGKVAPCTIKADATITFAAAKVGQFKFPGKNFLGDLVVADIKIPKDLPEYRNIPRTI